jgi:hypothetical protein
MICKNKSFQNWLKVLNILNVLLVVFSLSIIYAIFNLKDEKVAILKVPSFSENKLKLENLKIIKEESESHLRFSMPCFKKLLKVYKIPNRPNETKKENHLIYFKENFYPITTDKIYLSIENNKLSFSDKIANSYLLIEEICSDLIKITQKCHLNEHFHQILEKSYFLPINIIDSKEMILRKPFLDLINCEFLGLDRIGELKNKPSFLIKVNNEPYSIQEKVSLFFDGKWKIGISSNKAYAYIQKAQSEKITMQLWDECNENYKEIIINKKNLPKRNLRITDFISDIHMRNKNQISFLIEKQKIFLFENDILVKRNGKWMSFAEIQNDDELYLVLKKVHPNHELEINLIEKNRVILHTFKVPVNRGSFAKKTHLRG